MSISLSNDILHQWFSIPEYLHKMFKSMHIEMKAFCKHFSHQLSFLGQ